MKKLQLIKQSIRKGFVGLLGAAMLSSCSQGIKIEPIGWYDFNKDGGKDPIVLVTKHIGYDGYNKPFYHKQPRWLDSRYLGSMEFDRYGNEISHILQFNGTGFEMHDLRTPYITDRTRGENPEYPRNARVSDLDGDGKLDLELHTRINSEPVARRDVFYNIE